MQVFLGDNGRWEAGKCLDGSKLYFVDLQLKRLSSLLQRLKKIIKNRQRAAKCRCKKSDFIVVYNHKRETWGRRTPCPFVASDMFQSENNKTSFQGSE